MIPEHYSSGDHSERMERMERIHVTTAASTAPQEVIISLPVGEFLPAGSILAVTADCQFANELGVDVMIASFVVLTDTETGTTGQEICEAQGWDIMPDAHYGTPTRAASFRTREPVTSPRVNLVCYAASTAVGPDAFLDVRQDYGRMTALVWVPENDTGSWSGAAAR